MTNLNGHLVKLRALEPADLDFLFTIENNPAFWEISNTMLPFSKFILKKYIENATQDIYEAKQFRFVITTLNNETVGLIDLFEFNPLHKRVGVGLLIEPNYQGKGFGSEALQIVISYCFSVLQVHQIFANISSSNLKSRSLFEKLDFKKIGEKLDWNYFNKVYSNECMYQLINENEKKS